MHIMQPEARVQMYFFDFYRRLDEVGCSSFLTENQKKSVKLLLARVEPKILKTEMSSRVFYDPSLEEDVRLFIQALKEEAVACNKYATKSRTTTPPARVTTKSTPVDKTHPNTPYTYLNSDDGICSYSPKKELGVESRISRSRMAFPMKMGEMIHPRMNVMSNFRTQALTLETNGGKLLKSDPMKSHRMVFHPQVASDCQIFSSPINPGLDLILIPTPTTELTPILYRTQALT